LATALTREESACNLSTKCTVICRELEEKTSSAPSLKLPCSSALHAQAAEQQLIARLEARPITASHL